MSPPEILPKVLLQLVSHQVTAQFDRLCQILTPQALNLVESFAISDEMLSAPIARDWVGYNEVDNKGELDLF